MPSTARVLAFLLVPLFVWGACGSSSSEQRDGGIDSPPLGSGGQTSAGGATGGSGGALGSGGRATGGAAGGSGGALGSGGAIDIDGGVGTGGLSGTGGRATGGATGGGGAGGTSTARLDASVDLVVADARVEDGRDAGADGTVDVGGADGPPDLPIGTDSTLDESSAGTLESCFVGLPAQVGVQMIATKSTADRRVRVRIALDTEDRMGTSGTYGWGIVRVAVEVDGVVTCITDRGALRYTGSHHNCSDTATVTSGTTTYSFAAPDRPTATLTIDDGASVGSYTLTDTTCSMSWSPGVPVTCRSGGSC